MNLKQFFRSSLFVLGITLGSYCGALTEEELDKGFAELQRECWNALPKDSSSLTVKKFVDRGKEIHKKLKETYDAPSYFTDTLYSFSINNFHDAGVFYCRTVALLKHTIDNKKLVKNYNKSIGFCCCREIYPKLLKDPVDYPLIKKFTTFAAIALDYDFSDLLLDDFAGEIHLLNKSFGKFEKDECVDKQGAEKTNNALTKELLPVIISHLKNHGVKNGFNRQFPQTNKLLESIGQNETPWCIIL